MVQRIQSVAATDEKIEEECRPAARSGADPTRRRRAKRVKVLVAVGLRPPPGAGVAPCVAGELVWLPPSCGDPACDCARTFGGCASQGVTPAARIAELGVGRAAVLRAIRAGMCEHCLPPTVAAAAAERLLRIADAHPVGTLLQRRHGEALPLRVEEQA